MINKKDNYNCGIDVLKIIATIMIILMHILGQGGLIRNSEVGGANYYILWTIEAVCYVAVNLYALTTGYLNVKKEVKISGLVKRWAQVFFYCLFFTGMFAIFKPEVVSLKSWAKAFLPVMANQYWYFTQYFVLFMVMPFLNKMINSLEKKDLKKLVFIIILVLSFIPMVRQYDIFLTGHGFSAIWLMALYIIGGYFALYKDEIKYSKISLWLTIILSNIVTVGVKFIVDMMNHIEVNDMLNVVLIDYTSLPVVLSSLAIMLLVMNMKVKKGMKVVKFIGKLTFGIYLFHVNVFVWEYVLRDLFAFLGTWNPFMMIMGILGGTVAIFSVGGIFEYIRIKFFDIARINKLGDFVGNKLKELGDLLTSKL